MVLSAPNSIPVNDLDKSQTGNFLVLAEGKLAGNRISLNGSIIHIGSDSNCDIWLPQEDIKPWHALLAKLENSWFIKSLDPAFPALVNGFPVSTANLENGDRLGLGKLIFQLENTENLTRSNLEDTGNLRAALRIHAAALSAAHMELHQKESQLITEKQRWKIRCGQIAKELSRRQENLRKKTAQLQKFALTMQAPSKIPSTSAPAPSGLQAVSNLDPLALIGAIENRTKEQRKRLAKVYWSQRLSISKRFLAWEKALARRESALERSWQALVSKHKKQELETIDTVSSLDRREAEFRERLIATEQSLQIREKALKNAEQQSSAQNRRISEETERLRTSQREWISRLEALHSEETGLKRRIQNLANQISQPLPQLSLDGGTPTASPGFANSHVPLADQNNWAIILTESLAILSGQRETLMKQAEALAARDLEWILEQKAASAVLEDGLVRLSQQEHMLCEKHAQLDRLMEENAELQTRLDEKNKALSAQRRHEMENAAGLHARLSAQESFLEERKERLRELDYSVERLSSRHHGSVLRFLELAKNAAARAEIREKTLESLEKELRNQLGESQYHWQSMALERAELEGLRAELLSHSKSKSDGLASRLLAARATAAERTAGWIRVLEEQRKKLATDLGISRSTWKSLADLLDELEKALKQRANRGQEDDSSAFALIRHQEEAAFWREEMERVTSELSARSASAQEFRETIPISNLLEKPSPSGSLPAFRAA